MAGASKTEQLERFSRALAMCGLEIPCEVTTWMQSALIVSDKSKKKKVTFFDGMPWLDNPKSGSRKAFGCFWNAFASARSGILFIVCGSATSWIAQNLFRNRGGLRNRVTGKIRVNPFTLYECAAFLKSKNVSLSRYDIIESYMVFGESQTQRKDKSP